MRFSTHHFTTGLGILLKYISTRNDLYHLIRWVFGQDVLSLRQEPHADCQAQHHRHCDSLRECISSVKLL